MDSEISLILQLSRLLKYWWVIVFAAILGAGVGFALHWIQKPVYESRASITASINYVRTGKLTDVEEDEALNVVGDIIASDEIKELAFTRATQDAKLEQTGDLPQMIVEREGSRFVFRVRSTDPQLSANIVNYWSQSAFEILSIAGQNAEQAEQYWIIIEDLSSCIQRATMVQPAFVGCTDSNLTQLLAEISRVEPELNAAQQGARGVQPGMMFFAGELAEKNTSPVANSTNLLVFGGAVVGFMIGIIAVEFCSLFGSTKKGK